MKNKTAGQASPRRDEMKSHLIEESRHDPYKATKKLTEPSVCPQCMAAFLTGRWRWIDAPLSDAEWVICPACHRTKDRYPAGELTLSGSFLNIHAREIIRLARNVEAIERREHPLQRIMDIADTADQIVITTTDIHLPRRIARAITSAYKGELETHYDKDGHFVRISWRRDD